MQVLSQDILFNYYTFNYLSLLLFVSQIMMMNM